MKSTRRCSAASVWMSTASALPCANGCERCRVSASHHAPAQAAARLLRRLVDEVRRHGALLVAGAVQQASALDRKRKRLAHVPALRSHADTPWRARQRASAAAQARARSKVRGRQRGRRTLGRSWLLGRRRIGWRSAASPGARCASGAAPCPRWSCAGLQRRSAAQHAAQHASALAVTRPCAHLRCAAHHAPAHAQAAAARAGSAHAAPRSAAAHRMCAQRWRQQKASPRAARCTGSKPARRASRPAPPAPRRPPPCRERRPAPARAATARASARATRVSARSAKATRWSVRRALQSGASGALERRASSGGRQGAPGAGPATAFGPHRAP
jgi:hypothetical protein